MEKTSGCIENAKQPSPMEKSSRMTLHYVMPNNSAQDLVLPLPPFIHASTVMAEPYNGTMCDSQFIILCARVMCVVCSVGCVVWCV